MRDVASRWEPFVDDWLIDRTAGASLRLHHPVARDLALTFDAPWEGKDCAYVTILHYEGEYRMYYRGSQDLHGDEEPVTAMALSRDAISWKRPRLGLIEWHGSRANNIVWHGEESHNVTPFVDANPVAKAGERFKALASKRFPGVGPKDRGLVALVSEDGLTWRYLQAEPVIVDGAFDSQNLAFWDQQTGRYVAYYRDFRDGTRSIKRATSEDFVRWTPGEWLDFGDAPPEHLYTNATTRYFRAPHLLVAFPRRFIPDRQVVPEHYSRGVSDGVFMSSRDGIRWHRYLEAFIRPGRDRGNWTDRSNTVAWGLVPTAEGEISLYWQEHRKLPTHRLRRGTVRADGFASISAGYRGGEIVTHPLRFTGAELLLNFATSAAGDVRVELQDAEGAPIPGHTLADCPAYYGDAMEQAVAWGAGSSVARFAGRPIRVRLVLRDADVFALRFR